MPTRKPTLPALLVRVGSRPVLDPVSPSKLAAFQEFVGGCIDVINLDPRIVRALDTAFSTTLGPRACVVVHDEGILLDLPLNRYASLIAGQLVFGDAIVCDVP